MRSLGLLSLLLAGCGAADPCAGITGTCIAARVEGSIAGLDQLRISVEGFVLPRMTPVPASGFSLPVLLAITLPAKITGPTKITIHGLSAGQVIATSGVQSLDISAGAHTSASFTLRALNQTDGGTGDMPNIPDGGVPDMALPPGVSISPTTFNFPDTNRTVTSPTTLTLTITNNSDKPVKFLNVSSTGEMNSFKTIDAMTTCDLTGMKAIAAGGTCAMVISFTPAISGALSQTNTGMFDNGMTLSFTLSGTGLPWWSAEYVTAAKTLSAVWGSSASDVYAVGSDPSTPIYHSTGDGNWDTYSTGITAKKLFAVYGADAQHVWAGGEAGTFFSSTGGGGWIPEMAPTSMANVRGIWAGSPTDVWAVNDAGDILHSSGIGLGFQLVVTVPSPLYAIAGRGAAMDVAAVGQAGQIFLGTSNWTMPILPSPAVPLRGIWYLPMQSDFFIAGDVDPMSNLAIIWHRMGGNLFPDDSGGAARGLNAVSGRIDPMTMKPDIYSCGFLGGEARHSTGNFKWQLIGLPTHAALYGVWVAPTGEVFMVGDSMGMGAEIAHFFN